MARPESAVDDLPPPHSSLPNMRKMMTQWLSPDSNFIPELVLEHLREAHAYATECERSGAPLADVCGPRGDLYFIIKAMISDG